MEAFSCEERDGVLIGPVREPRNSASHLGAGSIHDDATAQKLGFRGGTVAGSLHMEQFPPLMVEAFGDDWLRTGGLSLYFKYATTDSEPVQAFARKPDGNRTEVWMDDAAGNRVADGTATLGGPDPLSTLRQRMKAMPAPEDLRILADVKAGQSGERLPTRIPEQALANRLSVITEPLAAYTDASIYGERIVTPALQVQVMRPGEQSMLPRNGDYGVGLFGAIELQLYDGPVFVEHDYECQSTVLAVGETPKTEYLYYEATLHEPGSEERVLAMIMMLRFMKASSSLWA
ncbi:MAG: hypothetical protein EP301_09950 [Gammaproteobacteria bacterium]|nr:MAG: hypothetical protein EP301_09950 [Gammaproteobacteria bacterium]